MTRPMASELSREFQALEGYLTRLGSGLLAVSGGVDSRFLGLVCARLNNSFQNNSFRVVFFSGPHQAESEQHIALSWLKKIKLPTHVLSFDPLEYSAVSENSKSRCYYCKREMFSRAIALAQNLGLPLVMDGSHKDDLASNRPGLKALKELGVVSPLAEAGLDKKEIISLATILGLERPDQSPRPCLLTRFAYGLAPDRGVLLSVSQAEEMLADIGLKEFRVRVLPPGRFVLQLDQKEKALWLEVGGKARLCLQELGMEPFEIRWDEQVSGFFDRFREGV